LVTKRTELKPEIFRDQPWRPDSAELETGEGRRRGLVTRGHPVLVRGHFLSNHVQKVVRARVAEESEVTAQVTHRLIEVGMGTEIVPEAAVLVVERDDLDRIVHRRLDLAPVSDDAGVLSESVDVLGGETRDLLRVEALERRTKAVP